MSSYFDFLVDEFMEFSFEVSQLIVSKLVDLVEFVIRIVLCFGNDLCSVESFPIIS